MTSLPSHAAVDDGFRRKRHPLLGRPALEKLRETLVNGQIDEPAVITHIAEFGTGAQKSEAEQVQAT